MVFNYDFDENDEIVRLLIEKGYKIVAEYQHPYSSDPSGVFEVSKDGKYYYAKFSNRKSMNSNNCEQLRFLHNKLSHLDITVRICDYFNFKNEKYKNIDGEMLIYESFGESFSDYIMNHGADEIVDENIRKVIENLHNHGYLHGDIHTSNIVVNLETKKVLLIDLDTCFHESCSLFLQILEAYSVETFEEAKTIELSNIYMEI